MRSVRSGSTASAMTTTSTLAPEDSAAAAAAVPEEFDAPSWINFEGVEYTANVPSIHETPPQE